MASVLCYSLIFGCCCNCWMLLLFNIVVVVQYCCCCCCWQLLLFLYFANTNYEWQHHVVTECGLVYVLTICRFGLPRLQTALIGGTNTAATLIYYLDTFLFDPTTKLQSRSRCVQTFCQFAYFDKTVSMSISFLQLLIIQTQFLEWMKDISWLTCGRAIWSTIQGFKLWISDWGRLKMYPGTDYCTMQWHLGRYYQPI